MTQEEKAKRYDEAYKVAEGIHRFSSNPAEIKRMEQIFPELRESEDEKIRKHLIRHFINKSKEDWNGVPVKSIITWLEKQGEPKPADKIEPQFKIGDWVVFNNKHQSIYQVEKIEDGYYILRHTHGGTFRVCVLHDESLRLWNISDAKNGDVLQLGEVTAIFKKYIGQEKCICYCSISEDGGFEIPIEDGEDNIYGCTDTTPATKEQREQLEKAMADAGFTFDFEKKELKKVENEPTWSEEEEYRADAIAEIKDEPKKELAETYLTVFDKKFPILPTLRGKQLADYKNFLNKCQQIFGLKYWGIHPTQAKLFEKLSLLWATWGAEHLQGIGKSEIEDTSVKVKWKK